MTQRHYLGRRALRPNAAAALEMFDPDDGNDDGSSAGRGVGEGPSR
ncbi:MAG: hypothetical protein JNM77_17815 [Pseudonocardia sp.]|nr:hypothetical protein [Pseudonocardia sp.]